MTDQQWLYERGELARGAWESVVDTTTPGWEHTGLRVARMEVGESLTLPAESLERIVLPLSGSFRVEYSAEGGGRIELTGRPSVFHGPSDLLYLPIDSALTVTCTGLGAGGEARVSLSEAPAEVAFPVRYVPASDVAVEMRGAGTASRQVHNFGTPANLDAAKFIVVEVITPGGNWSSFPAHKHDEDIPGHETALEEIYYFEVAPESGLAAPSHADAYAMFATYASGEPIAINGLVRTGDVALVPHGYHGPVAAPPGYDVYYLNVMAGPGSERSWLISDDPSQTWIRQTWDTQALDPRLPYLNEGTQ